MHATVSCRGRAQPPDRALLSPTGNSVSSLSDIGIQRALGTLPGWSRRGIVLTKTFQLATFPNAIAFVQRVAEAAEKADHHPDIDIRFTKVTWTLSTQSAGGITQKDIDLAGEIERLA